MKRDPELPGYGFQVSVIADNEGNIHIPFSGMDPRQYIIKAMRQLRNKQSHPGTLVAEIDVPGHVEFGGDQRAEKVGNFFLRDPEISQFPFYPHVKNLVEPVYMLIQGNDVSLVVVNEFGHICNNAFLILTVHEEDSRISIDFAHGLQYSFCGG
jgi:hypothetical protein